MLQIPSLQSRCEEFLLTQVSKDNCIGIWKIARAHNCSNLAQISAITIMEYFTEITQSDDFQKLDADEILDLIKHDDLAVTNEETVCDVVMTWVNFDPARQTHLAKIIEALRLPLVSPDYLFTMFQGLKLDLEAHQNLQDAFKYHLCPSRRSQFSADKYTQRKMSDRNDTLVIIGGLLKTVPRFQTTKEVVCYSFQQQCWYYLPSMPYDPGYEFAVCSHGSDIFVSGGWLKLKGMCVFRGEKNKWKTCDVMNNGRCGHTMLAMSNHIFVFGGRDGTAPAMTNIEEFDCRTKKWRSVGELILGIRSMSSAVVGENIFLFGGITENDKDSDRIQCFDTRLHTATIIGELPFACRLTRSVVVDTTVYIILPDGRIMTFDSSVTPRKVIQSLAELSFSFDTDDEHLEASSSSKDSLLLPSPSSPKSVIFTQDKESALGKVTGRISGFNQHHFEAIQHGGQVLLVGGKTPDNTILRDIMIVDPTNGKHNTIIDMPSARWCFGCVKIVMKKEYLQNGIGVV
ncbi:Kelch-like protein 5 [Mactra antiquata]